MVDSCFQFGFNLFQSCGIFGLDVSRGTFLLRLKTGMAKGDETESDKKRTARKEAGESGERGEYETGERETGRRDGRARRASSD